MRQKLKVREIAERVRAVLAEDVSLYNAGGVLSIRGLAERLDSNYSTVRRAVGLLEKEGLLRPQHGSGTLVVQTKAARTRLLSEPSVQVAHKLPESIGPWLLTRASSSSAEHHCGSSVCHGVMDAAMKEAEPLMLTVDPPSPDQLSRIGIRGALLHSVFYPHVQRQFAASLLPTVVLDDRPLVRGLDYVVADNRQGAELIAKQLVKLGHKKIAFVRSLIRRSSAAHDLHPDSDSAERAKCLRAALRRRGLDLPDRLILDLYGSRLRKREYSAMQLMNMRPRPTAFVFSGENRARTTVRVLRNNGVSVPGQVSVATFMSTYDEQEDLSGVEIDFEDIGRRGFKRLMDRAQGKVAPGTPRRVLSPVGLREGSTWGPPA